MAGAGLAQRAAYDSCEVKDRRKSHHDGQYVLKSHANSHPPHHNLIGRQRPDVRQPGHIAKRKRRPAP